MIHRVKQVMLVTQTCMRAASVAGSPAIWRTADAAGADVFDYIERCVNARGDVQHRSAWVLQSSNRGGNQAAGSVIRIGGRPFANRADRRTADEATLASLRIWWKGGARTLP
jgi:hypothetical protein